MQTFDSDGIEIAYEDLGEGPPIVLVHGYASSFRTNWRGPFWVKTLIEAGRRVVGLDCRGHGGSAAPHDPAAYEDGSMARDVLRLMDHVGIERADLMGYSMGGAIAAWLVVHHPERFGAVVIGGTGSARLGGHRAAQAIAEAMEAEDGALSADPSVRTFRAFAESGGNDLRAMAAIMRARAIHLELSDLATIRRPVLVVVGEKDALVRTPEALANAIPGARLFVIPGRDHVKAVGDSRHRAAVVDFLAEHPLAAAP